METYQIVINALIQNSIELSDNEKDGIKRAFSARGKYAGYLKKDTPRRDNTLARACWLAIQPNYYKTGVGAVLMLSDVEKQTYDKLSKITFPSILDKDMHNLQAMGAW